MQDLWFSCDFFSNPLLKERLLKVFTGNRCTLNYYECISFDAKCGNTFENAF